MEKEIEAETLDYLNYIRGLGIVAWIPGILDIMSVEDQCRSKVLCFNYKGSDIYVQGCGLRAKNDKSSTDFVKHLDISDFVNSVKIEEVALDGFESDLGNTAANDDNDLGVDTNSTADSRRSVAVQCRLGSLETSKPLTNHSHLERSVGSGIDGIENKTFVVKTCKVQQPSSLYSSSSGLGVQYRRIVEEKLTREVRVAKSYVVSSLPNFDCGNHNENRHLDDALGPNYTGKIRSSVDCKCAVEIGKKSKLGPGFVRQLIERFDVPDDDEQLQLHRPNSGQNFTAD